MPMKYIRWGILRTGDPYCKYMYSPIEILNINGPFIKIIVDIWNIFFLLLTVSNVQYEHIENMHALIRIYVIHSASTITII